MAGKAKRSNVVLRPHFKTHQSREIGQWFRNEGIHKATVSSVSMAMQFADAGWEDITIAFPVNLLEIDEINKLASSIKLQLLVESEETVRFLSRHLHHQVGFFIKIDVGTHRTGVDPKNFDLINAILRSAKEGKKLTFKGFLAHAGHSYSCRHHEDIIKVYDETTAVLNPLKAHYIQDYPDLIISYGDTPTCSVVDDLSAVDEVRAGNFVYYDLMQLQISSCTLEQIAVAVACPVVAIHPQRNEVVIYGGAVHFSKDRIELDNIGVIYGQPVYTESYSWGTSIEGAYLTRISQEHGILTIPTEKIKNIHVGDIIPILPIHSCLTANLLEDQQVV